MSARLTVTGTGEKIRIQLLLLSCCERSDIMNIGGRIYMSGLKNKTGMDAEKQLLSGLAHFYAVCCGEVHFPVSKSDIGCLKSMQRIRHRRSFFAGCRFTLAGILAAGIGSVMEGRFLRPERKAAKEIIWLSLLQTIIQYSFLYGTCTYQWSKSFYYRSGECIYCDSGSRIFVSSGKDYIKKNQPAVFWDLQE